MALSPQDQALLDRIMGGPMTQLAGLQVIPPTGGVASMPDIPRGGAFIGPAVDYGQAGQLDPAAASQSPVQRGPVPNIPAQLMGGGGPSTPAPAPAMASYGPMGGAAPGSAAFSPLPQAADRLPAIPPEQMTGGNMLGKVPMPEELMGMSVGLGPGGAPTVSGAAEEEAAYQRALARDAERAAQGLGPYRPGQPDAPKGGLGGLGGFFGSLFDSSTPRGEDFQNMMLGWAAGAGGTWQDSLAGGAKLVAAGRLSRKEKGELEKSKNKTLEWAVSNGIDPATAQTVLDAAGAKELIAITQEHIKNAQGGVNPDRYKTAGGMIFDTATQQYITPPEGAGGGTEYGLNPQFGVDAQGNPVAIQFGKDGRAVQTALPEGVQLSKEPIRFDAGTHFVLLDPITRQPIGQIPKDIAGAEGERIRGKAAAEAQISAPSQVSNAETALNLLDQLKNHPALDNWVGGLGVSSYGNSIRGTEGYDLERLVQQVQGGAFLTAVEQLRGLGALSNTEGLAATSAITRLNTGMSRKEFDKAISDYEKIVRLGMERARSRVGGSAPAPAAPADGGGDGWVTLPNGVRVREKR